MKPNKDKAITLAQKEISVYVWDAVNLEGLAFTLPEIQTLLDGVTVGGHKINDQQIAINQGKAWRFLFDSLKENEFVLTPQYAKKLHSIAGYEEALKWGEFRDGGVTIAGTDYLPPSQHHLNEEFEQMVNNSMANSDIYDQAISIFLDMARNQFFYDVNKRMGRFMMNGWLLKNGYPAINLPANKQLEFNQLMLDFYPSGNQRAMNEFMRSCIDERVVKIMSE